MLKADLPWIITQDGTKSQDYDKVFQIRYIYDLEYEKLTYLLKIRQMCEQAQKKKALHLERKWLGAYYNKELKEKKVPPILIKWIGEVIGYGVFALKAFKKGDFIGQYTGLLRKRKKRKDEKNSYCFEYFIGEYRKTPYTIDAQAQGNFTRFMNHKEKGNCDSFLVLHEGIMKVILYANQEIKEGEELCYDYGENYWKKRESPL